MKQAGAFLSLVLAGLSLLIGCWLFWVGALTLLRPGINTHLVDNPLGSLGFLLLGLCLIGFGAVAGKSASEATQKPGRRR